MRGLILTTVAFLALVAVTATKAETPFSPQQKSYWAFQKVQRREPPSVRENGWSTNPIDAFILANLEAKNIPPAPSADKLTLLRRATLDLTGLPPTPEEIESFLNDSSPKAFEKVVDRLLASPRYGERWARHWLDLARYAESEGFKADETRPNAWRYRDYVIKAFNEDKPYDRFIREQIAGDELWPENPEARIATAFNRHYPDESNARNLMQRRQEILNDITDTVGAVFTGLTIGCARCHDHKFDAILQKDYYRLQAFFANTTASDDMLLGPPDVLNKYEKQMAVWEEKTKDIRAEMEALVEPSRKATIKDYVDKYPEEIQVALKKAPGERTPFECQMVAKAELYLSPKSHQYIAKTEDIAGRLKGDKKKKWDELAAELRNFNSLKPAALPKGTGMHDLGMEAPPTFVLRRGVYDAQDQRVEPGFLSIIDPAPAKIAANDKTETTGRRTALANILADPDNPLTARVMVNRIWNYHFGRGIVGTPSDFGIKGEPPTHPELLDWLASEFVANSWSIKKMHRLIMLSRTYQQSSAANELALKADPDDKLLWRFPRHRLEGEVIRDSALAVSGLLNPKMGGPSIFPELPPGMSVRGGWPVTKDQTEQNRRSIYVFVRRNTRFPMFEAFDMPDTHESCSRRNVTTSPIQALTLLNSKPSLEWAESFAGRVLQKTGSNQKAQVDTAFELAYARVPTDAERKLIDDFFQRHRAILEERSAAGEKLALPPKVPETLAPIDGALLVDFCHMLMNANEFVYAN